MAHTLRIGVLATLYGPFQSMGEDGLRGVELAVREFGGKVAGRPIELIPAGTIGLPDIAENKARQLIEDDGVDFIVGPLSGNEGLAIRNYAQTEPDHVFLNGSSGAQELTIQGALPNFFNFSLNGVQVVAGVGTYAYHNLGYRRVVTVGEEYSYPFAQVGGFTLEFSRHGGRVVQKHWVALAESNFSEVIDAIPDDVDAVFVALGGTDAINFLRQYEQMRNPKPLLGGSITTDQSVLSEVELGDYLVGMVAGGPTADDNPDPAWQDFVDAYQAEFDDRFNFPSAFALHYYLNTKAALTALESIDGDLSKGQAQFKKALANLTVNGPCGPVWLDKHHGAVGSSYVTVTKQHSSGVLYRSLLEVAEGVNQTMGLPEKEYLALGTFDQHSPNF